jgi:hypothetical protein
MNKITELYSKFEVNKASLKKKKSNDPLINIYKNSKRKVDGNEFKVFVLFLIESYYRNIFSDQFDSISLIKVFDLESRSMEYFSSFNDMTMEEENELNFGTFKYFQDRIINIHALIENNFNSERSNGFLVHSQPKIMNGSLKLELFSTKEWRNLKMKEIQEKILNDMSKVDFHFKLHLKYKKNSEENMNIENNLRKLISRIHYKSPDQKSLNEDHFPIQIKEIEHLHYKFMDRFGMVNIWDVLVMPSEYESNYLKDSGYKVKFISH